MFPQTLAPFVLTLIRRANVESKYDYYQARCFELEKVLEKQQMKEVDTVIYGCYKEVIGILFLIWSLIVTIIVVQTYKFKYDKAVRNKYRRDV